MALLLGSLKLGAHHKLFGNHQWELTSRDSELARIQEEKGPSCCAARSTRFGIQKLRAHNKNRTQPMVDGIHADSAQFTTRGEFQLSRAFMKGLRWVIRLFVSFVLGPLTSKRNPESRACGGTSTNERLERVCSGPVQAMQLDNSVPDWRRSCRPLSTPPCRRQVSGSPPGRAGLADPLAPLERHTG